MEGRGPGFFKRRFKRGFPPLATWASPRLENNLPKTGQSRHSPAGIPPFSGISAVKNGPHICVPAAFFRALCIETRGKNQGCRKAINGHLARGKSAVFWQTGRGLAVFSTGNEKTGITVFSGREPDKKQGNGARFGVILLWGILTIWILGCSYGGSPGGGMGRRTLKRGFRPSPRGLAPPKVTI